jgi:hypothetical protein
MKKVTILFILCIVFISQSCSTLGSTTYIDPQQSFVLGKGKHGAYKAYLSNPGSTDISVYLENNGKMTSLGVLKPKEAVHYRVPANYTVRFHNADTIQGVVRINAIGDTRLSMGYQEDKNP